MNVNINKNIIIIGCNISLLWLNNGYIKKMITI